MQRIADQRSQFLLQLHYKPLKYIPLKCSQYCIVFLSFAVHLIESILMGCIPVVCSAIAEEILKIQYYELKCTRIWQMVQK